MWNKHFVHGRGFGAGIMKKWVENRYGLKIFSFITMVIYISCGGSVEKPFENGEVRDGLFGHVNKSLINTQSDVDDTTLGSGGGSSNPPPASPQGGGGVVINPIGLSKAAGKTYLVSTETAGVLVLFDNTMNRLMVKLPTPTCKPLGVSANSDGSFVVSESGNGKIAFVDTDLNITELYIGDDPTGVMSLPDGTVCYTKSNAGKIGRANKNGVISEYYVGSGVWGIWCDSGGNVWYTKKYDGKIGKITYNGSISEWKIEQNSAKPENICLDSFSNVWYLDSSSNSNKLYEINKEYAVSVDPIGLSRSGSYVYLVGSGCILFLNTNTGNRRLVYLDDANSIPLGVSANNDKSFWVTETNLSKIVYIDTNLVQHKFYVGEDPTAICGNKSDVKWYTKHNAGKIGKITMGGDVSEIFVGYGVWGICQDVNGVVWYTKKECGRVGYVSENRIVEWSLPDTMSKPEGITALGDGTIWVFDSFSGKSIKIK